MAAARRLVLCSYRAHPFGGGEEDLLDKAKWAAAAGWQVVWVSHATAQGDAHVGPPVTRQLCDGVQAICMPFTIGVPLFGAIANLHPDVVVVIGRMIEYFAAGFTVCPWIAIYHFWTGLVELGPQFNRHILDNAPNTPSPIVGQALRNAARVAVVSPFMQQVCLAAGIVIPTCIASAPCIRASEPYDVSESRPWVTFVNGHSLKGGWLIPALITAAPHVPVRVIFTERDTDDALAVSIVQAMCARNSGAPVELLNRRADLVDTLRQTRLIVCASVVDETFGRVAAEAMAVGVPVVLAQRGNLAYLGGDGAMYVNPDTPAAAAAQIADLWGNTARLQQLSEYYKRQAARVSPARARLQFMTLLDDCLTTDRPCVLFFAPWHDQGLGTQVRSYCKSLEAVNIRTAVCSFTPYLAETTHSRMFQADAAEWDHPRVYYSPHTREAVTDAEILACIRDFKPQVVVIPETCWRRVFEVARLCRANGVRVVGIPNIELVRTDELTAHKDFDTLLANNRLCQRVLADHGLDSTWVGFELDVPPSITRQPTTGLRFLLVGGYNLDGRKQGPVVVRAFVAALGRVTPRGPLPQLIITAQTEASSAHTAALCAKQSCVRFVLGNQRYADIHNMLLESDVAVLPTRHEGLGLGFYEARAAGCAILTVDTPPHNEIVTDNVDGWTLPGASCPVVENTFALVSSFAVDVEVLTAWFAHAFTHPEEVRAICARVSTQTKTLDMFRQRFAACVLGKPVEPVTFTFTPPAPVIPLPVVTQPVAVFNPPPLPVKYPSPPFIGQHKPVTTTTSTSKPLGAYTGLRGPRRAR